MPKRNPSYPPDVAHLAARLRPVLFPSWDWEVIVPGIHGPKVAGYVRQIDGRKWLAMTYSGIATYHHSRRAAVDALRYCP
jgi:hypothetical protein